MESQKQQERNDYWVQDILSKRNSWFLSEVMEARIQMDDILKVLEKKNLINQELYV